MDALILNFRDMAKMQLLKYVAGYFITCPLCGKILDWKTTVSFTGENSDGVAKEATVCLDCYKDVGFQNGLKSLRRRGFKFYKFYRLRTRNE